MKTRLHRFKMWHYLEVGDAVQFRFCKPFFLGCRVTDKEGNITDTWVRFRRSIFFLQFGRDNFNYNGE